MGEMDETVVQPDAGEGDQARGEKSVKRRRTKSVTVIATEGQSALVQWADKGHPVRRYVPAGEVKDNRCPQDVLSAGLPYGAPWSEFVDGEITISPVDVELALYNAGFWTEADIQANPAGAQRVINNLIGVNAALLARAARQRGG